MPLTLVLPGLLASPGRRIPMLERWLARADVERAAAGGAEDWVARLHGLDGSVPWAALSMAGEAAPRPGRWLRADPVHLQVDGDGLVLHAATSFDVADDEARALADALEKHFANDGFEFHVAAPRRWYVRVPGEDLPATVPLHAAAGRDVFGMLPTGSGRFNWRSAITEAQMVLGAHPANARRESAGAPAINSVWFWGEGTLAAAAESPFARVHSEDPLVRGLAAASGVASAATPPALRDIPGSRGESVLVVPHAEAVTDEWLGPLARAVDAFAQLRVILPGPRFSLDARIDSRHRWRWFRSPRPLESHA